MNDKKTVLYFRNRNSKYDALFALHVSYVNHRRDFDEKMCFKKWILHEHRYLSTETEREKERERIGCRQR